MPAKAPPTPIDACERLRQLGARIAERRKALRVSMVDTAEAAGLSRVTLHRIERGEPTVAMGAYANVLEVLDLGPDLDRVGAAAAAPVPTGRAAARTQAVDVEVIELDRYPQLKLLAWGRHTPTVTGREALALYERNWRHVDQGRLEAHERALLSALTKAYGHGALLV